MICINCIWYVITLRFDRGVLKRGGGVWANCYRVEHNYHSHLIKSTTDSFLFTISIDYKTYLKWKTISFGDSSDI